MHIMPTYTGLLDQVNQLFRQPPDESIKKSVVLHILYNIRVLFVQKKKTSLALAKHP